MEQVTIHYKNNPKDYKIFFEYMINHTILGIVRIIIYVVNFLAILLTINSILLEVVLLKIPFKTVIENNQAFLTLVILGTLFLQIGIYIGTSCIHYKTIWKLLQKEDSIKIKSIVFRENVMKVQMISEDKDIKYSSFTKIKIKRNSILFLKGKQLVFFCPKQYFTEEEWNTVKKWLK